MRSRFAVPVALLAAAAVPATAQAGHKHPGHNGQKVSINATPNPVVTGDPLTIYGQLKAKDVSNRLVVLWHRVAGQSRFTVVQKTHTTATGFYKFDRADGIVRTNRNWYVKSAGARSRTVHERVYAELSLADPASPSLTNHQVAFNGAVTPGGVHAGDRVYLQQQVGGNGDSWKTVDRARVRAGGVYTINHRFTHPGSKTLRTLLKRDKYNLRTTSSPVSVDIEQAQNPRFTLTADSDRIDAGGTVHLTGTLAAPNNAGRTITLYARGPKGGFKPVAVTSTDVSGNYTFTQSPIYNTVYEARSGKRHSAMLFEGVRDVVSVTPSATTTVVGGVVKFEGSVLPNKAGHVIYLEQKGDDGAFHVVQVHRVRANASYTLTHRFHSTGTKVFRVLIPGGPWNNRGIAGPVTIVVS